LRGVAKKPPPSDGEQVTRPKPKDVFYFWGSAKSKVFVKRNIPSEVGDAQRVPSPNGKPRDCGGVFDRSRKEEEADRREVSDQGRYAKELPGSKIMSEVLKRNPFCQAGDKKKGQKILSGSPSEHWKLEVTVGGGGDSCFTG